MAFHPSGYILAVGFKTKLHIYHLMYDQLRTYKDLNLKNVSCLRYANGGQYLTAAFEIDDEKFPFSFKIYNAYTLECVFDKNTGLSRHNGPKTRIVDMAWS